MSYPLEVVSKVIDPVILNLFQDLNALYIRSRNKFGMTRSTRILTFETASYEAPFYWALAPKKSFIYFDASLMVPKLSGSGKKKPAGN